LRGRNYKPLRWAGANNNGLKGFAHHKQKAKNIKLTKYYSKKRLTCQG
jgi:hypothetical protein